MTEQLFLEPIHSQAVQGILPYLPPGLRQEIGGLPQLRLAELEELRLRAGFPIALRFGSGEAFLAPGSRLTSVAHEGRILKAEELKQMVLLLSDSSFYALEEELRRGYITLPGGHRAGLCGRAVLEKGAIRSLKAISSINLRLARFIEGNGARLLPHLFLGEPGLLQHTLIVSPPGAGKTTLLRDLARLLSQGGRGFSGYQVGIVDERSEIAAMYGGQPQLPLGPRCDVLDACPKGEGMMLMIRSMAPQVLICDEIGRPEDAAAIQEAANAGIIIIASAHGSSSQELLSRPVIRNLLAEGIFGRLVFLSRRRGPGTLEHILDGALQPVWEAGAFAGAEVKSRGLPIREGGSQYA